MKKLSYKGKKDFQFCETQARACSDYEVEIKPLILGLCGSDLHKFLKQAPDKNYLLTDVLGHEICGVVTCVGKKVENVEIGDRIVVNPFNVPDKLKLCESFSLVEEKIDIVGRNIDGGYSEIIYLPENCVYKIPNNISNEDAIFIDDIAVAYHGIHYISQYKSIAENIAIIGDGPLGILCYRLLNLLFPDSKIVLVSRNLEKLKNLNIETINFSEIDRYIECFDVVLEVVGGEQSDTLNKAILIGKPNCIILCYGVFNFNYMADIDVRTLFYKQGMIKGINSYCNKFNDFNMAIDFLSKGDLYVNDLITKKVPFVDAVDYIKNYSKTKNNIKTIFKVK